MLGGGYADLEVLLTLTPDHKTSQSQLSGLELCRRATSGEV